MSYFKKITLTLNILLALFLLSFGVALFFIIPQKNPQLVARETKVIAKHSSQLIINGEFLILFDPLNISLLDKTLEELGLEIKIPILNWLLVARKQKKGQEIIESWHEDAQENQSILTSLLNNPLVLDAQFNVVMPGAIMPSNHSVIDDWQFAKIHHKQPFSLEMPKAWEKEKGNSSITIAIIDNFMYDGIFTFTQRFKECSHRISFFEPYKNVSTDTTDSSIPHGEVSLLAVGACNNVEKYSAGIDWHAQILAVQRPGLGHAQSFLAALFASGIDVCTQSILPCKNEIKQKMLPKPADVLLMPFGSSAPELLQFSSDMMHAINKKNVIAVSAAGNNNESSNDFFPGGVQGIINVGSYNKYGLRSAFSNWGERVDLLAPGENTKLQYLSGEKNVNGTSMASAYAAGSISLLKSINKNFTTNQIEYILQKSADRLTCENYCPDNIFKNSAKCQSLCCNNLDECGALVLNVSKAIDLAKNPKEAIYAIDSSSYYLIFKRYDEEAQSLIIQNQSNRDVTISSAAFNENLTFSPQEFTLGIHQTQEIKVSFHNEPFKGETSSIEFSINNADLKKKIRVFVEYIPKK